LSRTRIHAQEASLEAEAAVAGVAVAEVA